MFEQSIENITGFAVGVVSALIGGWDFTLQVLLILIAIDIFTGVFKGLYGYSFTSKQFREGLVTKAGYILILILYVPYHFPGYSMLFNDSTMSIFFNLKYITQFTNNENPIVNKKL